MSLLMTRRDNSKTIAWDVVGPYCTWDTNVFEQLWDGFSSLAPFYSRAPRNEDTRIHPKGPDALCFTG